MPTAVGTLRELEELGKLSRNQNFWLHQRDASRPAMRLKRRLDALSELLLSHHDAGLKLRLEPTDNASISRLDVTLPRVRAQVSTYLQTEELVLLLRDPQIEAIFVDAGIAPRE